MAHTEKLLPMGCLLLSKPKTLLVQKWLTKAFYATSVSAARENVELSAKPISEMPEIPSLPLIGSTFAILTRKDFDNKKLHIFWKNVINQYGPTVRVIFPGVAPFVAVTKPEDVETMYQSTMNNPIRDAFHSVKKIRDEMADGFLEKKAGLLAENNEEWWRVRSRAQTPMLKLKNVVRYLPQMDQVTLQFMDRIAELQREHGEMPPDFLQDLYKWALESVSLVSFERRLGCLDRNLSPGAVSLKLIQAVNDMFQCLNDTELNVQWWRIFPTKPYRKLKTIQVDFLNLVLPIITELEAEVKAKASEKDREPSLLEVLLQREGLSRKDVITIILDMLTAGIDTTSHTIGFTLYLLTKNKGAQKRLQEEVDSVLGDGEGPITETHLKRLSFLKACIKESLRVFPLVLGHSRILLEDTVIGGYNVPKGYNILVINSVITKDESLFPHPYEFRPERWGRDEPLGPIHPYASLPFSHGSRMCIGRRIAEQEMYTFLARVMHRYNVDYKYKDVDMVTRLVTMPSEPLRFEFSERR